MSNTNPIQSLYAKFGKWTNTIIIAPHPITIGNTAEDILFSLLKAKRESKKVLIIRAYQLPYHLKLPLTNSEIFKLESSLISQFSGIVNPILSLILTLYCGVARALKILFPRLFAGITERQTIPMLGQMGLWQPSTLSSYDQKTVDQYKWPFQMSIPVEIKLNRKQWAQAHTNRVEMGLGINQWFVCLHVRESGFWNDRHVSSFRDAEVTNYVDAIKYIVARGGIVVRLGDPSMKPLPEMKGVIDYPFTHWKSDLMDLYLINQCSLYIGMQSGILDIATLFCRPTVITNMTGWLFNHPMKTIDRGILKHLYSIEHRRVLSIEEWLYQPWDAVGFQIDQNKFKLYENTSTEILMVVQEFFECDKKMLSKLQINYNSQRLLAGRKLLSKADINADNCSNVYTKYRVASRLEAAQGTLGNQFLLTNWSESSQLSSNINSKY